jgi:chromate transporter
MKAIILYALLLKATVSTFNGLASLPVLRNDLVTQRHLISDKQLDAAVVVNRLTPGPVGLYVVSVGYFADGYPGAFAGLMALLTPALLVIPILKFARGRAEHPRVKCTIEAVVLASAGMLLAASVPIAREALDDPISITVAVVSTIVLLSRKLESVWVILFGAIAELTASSLHLVRN